MKRRSAQMNHLGRSVHARYREGMRGLALVFSCVLAAVVSAQATDLIISEYVEGSGSNKYIELYNGTAGNINLANYQLILYANGSPLATTTNTLSGTLASGATIVYKNSSAVAYGGATTVASAVNYNGDDAIALYKISPAGYVDIFGQIGCDPGTQWTAGGLSTLDRTLVRNSNICTGVTVNPSGACGTGSFTTLTSQWTGYAQDDVSHLGSHTMTCGPTVNFAVATSSALENAGTATVTLNINPAPVFAEIVYVTITGGTATYGGGNDYTTTPAPAASVIPVSVPAGWTSVTFTINLVDDAVPEPDETIDFTITSATGSISLGSNLAHVFTITNDDVTPTINFSILNITVLENAGAQVFTLNFLPTTHPSGDFTIQITNGPGATYGALPNDDYTTAPSGPGTFIVPFGPNAPTASFTVNVNDDANQESTEMVTFTIIAVNPSSGTMAIGSNNNATLVIGDNDSPPTVLAPGDLAIVGVNANDNACDGGDPADYDYVSFFCFQEITYGTEIILTDNGYERCTPPAASWGNVEGTVRMKRTGPAIPAGQVITFRIKGTGLPNVSSVAPDAGWSSTSIGIPGTSIALNVNGDQLFFMQGGTWTPGTSGFNNASYSGTLLYAFSTNPTFPWSADCISTPNQRSNLPPGVECFSMAPTGASDFNKWVGTITPRDQRDWIIAIDDTAKWDSYSTCTLYNSSGFNWLTAPILPIIPGAMTHGLWRGAKNTDWFECKNWDDARIPDAATDVEINSTSLNNCFVGLSPGPNAGVCASLLQTAVSTSAPRQLVVADNSSLTIGGPLTIHNISNTNALTTQVWANATLNATSVDIVGFTPGGFNAELWAKKNSSRVNVTADLTIAPGGRLDLQTSAADFGTLDLGGDLINQENETHFREFYSTVILSGAIDQTIQNTDPLENFYNMQVNKPGGDVYLTNPITIEKQLDLTQGRIFSTPANLPILIAGSTAINASDASFVHGPVKKVGNTPFTFPIGKGSSYRPSGLRDFAGAASSAFTSEYFPLDPYVAIAPLVQPTTLDHISHCEYWNIERSAGSANARVVLSWDTPESCGVTSDLTLSELRVAHWNGSIWEDRGQLDNNGTYLSGDVSSFAVETSFSPWTLASITQNNPLPIELLSFTAQPNGNRVDLNWSTASEQNNDHFTVERSADALNFTPLLQVPGAGNSQGVLNYSDVDLSPLGGLSYYRLRQTDIDGTAVVSDAVPVFFSSSKGQPLQVLYGDNGPFLLHDFAPGSIMEVMDLTGRIIGSTGITAKGLVKIPLDGLSRGVYLLRMTDGTRTESTRLAY